MFSQFQKNNTPNQNRWNQKNQKMYRFRINKSPNNTPVKKLPNTKSKSVFW